MNISIEYFKKLQYIFVLFFKNFYLFVINDVKVGYFQDFQRQHGATSRSNRYPVILTVDDMFILFHSWQSCIILTYCIEWILLTFWRFCTNKSSSGFVDIHCKAWHIADSQKVQQHTCSRSLKVESLIIERNINYILYVMPYVARECCNGSKNDNAPILNFLTICIIVVRELPKWFYQGSSSIIKNAVMSFPLHSELLWSGFFLQIIYFCFINKITWTPMNVLCYYFIVYFITRLFTYVL